MARLHLTNRIRQRGHQGEDCLVHAACKEAQLCQVSQVWAIYWILPPNTKHSQPAVIQHGKHALHHKHG